MHRPVNKSAAPLARMWSNFSRAWQRIVQRNSNTPVQTAFIGENVGVADSVETIEAWNNYAKRRSALDLFSAKNAFAVFCMIGVGVLIWGSLYLGAMRIYQVDECMETYVSSIIATASDKSIAGHATLFQLILSFFINTKGGAVDFLMSGRLIMLMVFWINWMLMASATGAQLFSRRWIFALAGAATLAPMWDYGFEIRHDNLMLTGLLLLWGLARFGNGRLGSYVVAGVVSTVLEFIAFKSFAYSIPISAAMVAFRRPGTTVSRLKLAAMWLAGAVAAFLILRFVFQEIGIWELFKGTASFLSTASSEGRRFGAGIVLNRLLTQTPLLLAIVCAAVMMSILEIWKSGRKALRWDGNLPEVFLFLGFLSVLMVNPAPFPYNVLHLVPYAYILAFRYGGSFFDKWVKRPEHWIGVASLVVFAHLVPFGKATLRHLQWSNTRQEELIRLAESLTDSKNDPVYDAIGMVPTRPIVDNRAFLHSLNFKDLVNGPGPQIRDMLKANPAAVIIPSYRTDWLPQADHDFINQRYVSVSDDFWVLGTRLSAGGGTFEIVHPGRYRISALRESDLTGTYPEGIEGLTVPEQEGKISGTLDGQPIEKEVFELKVGTHRLETSSDCESAVVWVGPHVNRLHRQGGGDHRLLFFNWY